MSLATASLVFNVAQVVLIAASALVAICALLIWWTGSIKEEYAARAVAEAGQRAATAQAEAARVRATQEQHGPRRVKPEQAKALSDALKDDATFRVVVRVAGDPEANAYAGDIMGALRGAGVQVSIWPINLASDWSQGVHINAPKGTPEAALIRDAFSAAGIAAQFHDEQMWILTEFRMPGSPPPELTVISVGPKPAR